MRDQYAAVAPMYDRLAADPAMTAFYREWRQALLDAARNHRVSIRVLVDLACGTGNTAIPWTRRGWKVIGVDTSAAMLRQARRKSDAVRWYRQDLAALRLAATADAVTSHGDALNHLLDAQSLQRVFGNTARILRDGGLFVFDLSTVNWFRWLAVREKLFPIGRSYCAARNAFDSKSAIATFRQTWFVARGRLFQKREVVVRQRAYRDGDVRRMLKSAGFRVASVIVQRKVDGKPARLIYVAIKQRQERARSSAAT